MTEKKKRVGRPTNKELDANTNGKRNKVGRPPGVAAALKEYQAMMVTSPKSRKVLQKILDAALDDDHKFQSAAWKIVADRIVPLGMFDTGDAKKPSGISITINTVDAQEVIVEEAEYEKVDDDV
jgi:hypothetical protein|tara:strand:+ start:273 stop:644 length:372 start_codon:yes stop_codon:yes gene_type:complete